MRRKGDGIGSWRDGLGLDIIVSPGPRAKKQKPSEGYAHACLLRSMPPLAHIAPHTADPSRNPRSAPNLICIAAHPCRPKSLPGGPCLV